MKIASTLVLLTVGVLTLKASAAPSGPSAREAARLKKHPTSVWLAHYLPDDRYKIAGGVWKYVSTDLDTYYHRPDSPNMMRQPAGRVIGFASVQEAEEAGYRPDPAIGSFGSLASGSSVSTSHQKRITLSDGTSSIVLPAGWSKLAGTSTKSANAVVTTDQLNGPKGQRLVITTVTVANNPNIDMARFATVEFFKSMQGGLRQFSNQLDTMSQTSGRVNSQFSNDRVQKQINELQNSTKVSRVVLSGMPGISVQSTVRHAGQPSRGYLVGRGPKLWSISDFSVGKQSALGIVRTMQFR